VADVVPPSTSLAFVTKMSVERKSALPSAVTVKSWQQTIRIVEKLRVTSHFVKHERIVDVCHNVQFAHVQLVIMLIELKKVLSQKGARCGVMVKALHYKPAGRGFNSCWCHWNFSVT
jgi:hypothetical protein